MKISDWLRGFYDEALQHKFEAVAQSHHHSLQAGPLSFGTEKRWTFKRNWVWVQCELGPETLLTNLLTLRLSIMNTPGGQGWGCCPPHNPTWVLIVMWEKTFNKQEQGQGVSWEKKLEWLIHVNLEGVYDEHHQQKAAEAPGHQWLLAGHQKQKNLKLGLCQCLSWEVKLNLLICFTLRVPWKFTKLYEVTFRCIIVGK